MPVLPIDVDRPSAFRSTNAQLADVLDMPNVRGYLATIDRTMRTTSLTADYAIALGLIAVHEARCGALDEHLRLGAETFDAEEFADLVAAALAWLLPLVLRIEQARDERDDEDARDDFVDD